MTFSHGRKSLGVNEKVTWNLIAFLPLYFEGKVLEFSLMFYCSESNLEVYITVLTFLISKV